MVRIIDIRYNYSLLFCDANGHAVAVTSDQYINTLTEFFFPLLRRDIDIARIWYQHRTVRHRIIYRFGDTSWPARSPDLTVCNFICGVI
ncbi:hypothetical protein ANN_27288 [Periplaneta americana]|uniref:Uncharacterized protein n=1 Tax=Periplaneta americana TaxID=6978 RepID=A0ABQ8RXR7_PERAM|nr:hypothetical protein ANN_27288 [Periplaneta americana]